MSTQWRREGNLPEDHTSFVGRQDLLEEITRSLSRSRLVTITGLGGVGKSRLAREVARATAPLYPDGVWFVELGTVHDPDTLGREICTAFGLADMSARPDVEILGEYLSGGRHLLLVLDTCERLLEPVRDLAQVLQEVGPNVHILATSRSPLRAFGERVIAVPPMTVASDEGVGEAMLLFAERARAIIDQWALGPHNRETVAALCRRLDGIPLALELAAGRLRGLSVERILDLVSESLTVLRASAPDNAPSRHHTLLTTIGWSHQLCEDAEKLLWARLSVFSGDFDVRAVTAVCGDWQLPPDEIPDVLDSLVNKSIITAISDGRYRMLDTVREYGAVRLRQLGQSVEMRSQHLRYYLTLARRGERAWGGSGQVRWYHRMRLEAANIRAAIDYSVTSPEQAPVGLELAARLWFLWLGCGYLSDGRHYLLRMLSVCTEPSAVRCSALWAEAYVANAQGDLAAAQAAAEQCLQEATELDLREAQVMAHKMMGTTAMLSGDFDRATDHLQVAIEYMEGLAERRVELMAGVVELGMTTIMRGNAAAGIPLLESCRDMCEAEGELWMRSYALYVLTLGYHQIGEVDRAVESCRQSLRIKRQFSDVLGILLCLDTLAQLVQEAGWPGEMVGELQGATETSWRDHGLPMLGSPPLTEAHQRAAAAARASIGKQAFEEARRRGSRLDLMQAIAYACGDSGELASEADQLAPV